MAKVIDFPLERCRPSAAQLEQDRIRNEKFFALLDRCCEILMAAVAQMRQGGADDELIQAVLRMTHHDIREGNYPGEAS
jgi:uncharacterized membrane protein